jgi:thioredoxin reductase/CRP-like cAMP-binding protein/Fe-S-cluster-containing hydrogenase component 2
MASDPIDVAIIGAGPAGIAAAANAAKHQMSHALFEKAQLANTIYDYQKAKLVMAEPRKLPLRSLIDFQEGSREAVLGVWEQGVRDTGVNLVRAEVRSIKKSGEFFQIQHGNEVTRAKSVILSIGVQGTPRKLGVPGEELPHVVYSLSDPDEFKGLDILVAGAGDSAIENAVALSKNNRVMIMNRSAEFARAKDGNVKLISEAIAEGRIRLFASSTLNKITQRQAFVETPDGEVEVRCDRVIVRAGAVPPRKFLEGCGLQMPADPAGVPKVDSHYQSNVPGLYLVGALIGYPLIKQAMNQGYEVIEHILGNPVEPADQGLIQERLAHLPGTVEQNYKLIKDSLPLFSDLSEPQFRELLTDSTVHALQDNQIVFQRLDYTDTFFSIVSGAVAVHLDETQRIQLTPGAFFGELGLISGRRRSATVSTVGPTLLLETPRKQILKLISSVESVKKQLDQTFTVRSILQIFPEAEPSFLQVIVHRSKQKVFKKGESLFKEGDPGDALYVIRKGSVKISKKDPHGVDITRSYVPAGNFVGEMSLLDETDAPRSATVTAVVACETIVVEKDSFRALMYSSEALRQRIHDLAEKRKLEGLTSDHNRKVGAALDFMFKEGITDASNVLVIDSDLCVACDNCETACAATHNGETRLDRKGGKFYAAVQLPISCRHCENPLCMVECPPDALARNPDGEVVIRDSCIGCGNCVTNCPYGVIRLVHEQKKKFDFWAWIGLRKPKPEDEGPAKAAKCDMCSTLPLGPACVRACPTGAALRINPSELAGLMRRKGGML